MKKYLLYTLAILSAFSFSSCSDDDGSSSTTNREWMTMFICDNNRGKGDDYPYNSGIEGVNGNDIHLYWYGVNDCAGFQIRQALQPNVSGGADAWGSSADNGLLLLDTIVGPDVLDLVIKNQQYSTDFRFAIRVLSKKDDNKTDFSHASKWYGHGGGRQWAEYLGITTSDRYATPFCVYVDASKTTETTMRVMLNRKFSTVSEGVSADDQLVYRERFEMDGENFVYQWLEVEASPSNPSSTVGEKWKKYKLSEEDFERGYVEIDGLQKNSVYVINVRNENVKVKWDAYYNTYSSRSDGEPGAPIEVTHKVTAPERDYFDTQEAYDAAMVEYEVALKYDAMRIDFMLTDFISDVDLAEGQEYLLEGGKTYCIFNNLTTCKGFVLRTKPEDVAAGKRAKVLLGGMYTKGTDVVSANLVFGRQPQAGEGGEVYMKMLEFHDIDFDCPLARNYGDVEAGLGGATGNYFINMYSNGMAVHLEDLVIKNCTFKRMVRGFIREQGVNYKIWDNVLIEDNQFFDCGYHTNGAGGYNWVAGSGNNANSNLYKNFVVRNNTFFDCPFPSFFNETQTKFEWKAGAWNITFENNTLVNWNTRAAGNVFNMRRLPDGSVFNVKNNLIILTKKDGDPRDMVMGGADIRNTATMDDGTAGHVTLNFGNNYSTNTFLTNGQIFSTNAWNSTKNNFGTLVSNQSATLNGSLDVLADDISPTELMVSPNPPHVASGKAAGQFMHRADALDGTGGSDGANLYYNKTDKVFNSAIYKNNVGDPRWRK